MGIREIKFWPATASVLLLFAGCMPSFTANPALVVCAGLGYIDTVHLTFDASGLGPQFQLFDHGSLVLDTCHPVTAADGDPIYSLEPVAGTTDREIKIEMYRTPLLTNGDFELQGAPDCGTPFGLIGTTSVTYSYDYSVPENASACSEPTATARERITF
jgi:hypothetical protein